jgi:N-carbamoylputrescine amidase
MPIVAAIQQKCFTSKQANLEHSSQLINQAVTAGAQLVVLQELHSSQYFCQTEDVSKFDLAEPVPGPSSDFLSACAAKHRIVIVGSVFEKRAPGLYHNTAVVCDNDGSIAGCYRKMHIPDDPGFYEKFYFTPGDASERQGFQPIKTSIGKLGVLVCWDQWFPEAARLMALAGADVLIYPTAIGWDSRDSKAEQQRQQDAWITIQRSHAIANNLPVIVANRTGHEPDPSTQSPGIEFWGSSFITGQQGELLKQADNDSETVLTTSIDWQKTDQLRRIWPYFRDRRIDAYQQLNKRYID